MFCPCCGAEVAESDRFCPQCGQPLKAQPSAPQTAEEKVLGCVLFGHYYWDICFTDRRVIQFEVMRNRWKFLLQALGPKVMMVDKTSSINEVLPFFKAEIPRADISAIVVKNHGRAHRGRIRVVKRSGEAVDLARLDVDTEKESYAELVDFVKSIYPEIPKTID